MGLRRRIQSDAERRTADNRLTLISGRIETDDENLREPVISSDNLIRSFKMHTTANHLHGKRSIPLLKN